MFALMNECLDAESASSLNLTGGTIGMRSTDLARHFREVCTCRVPDLPLQDYFVRSYRARGIDFDRILLWEANMSIKDEQIYQEVRYCDA